MRSTTKLVQNFHRYVSLAQRYGFEGSVRRFLRKMLSYACLEIKTIRCTLRAKHTTSDQAFMKRIEREWNSLGDVIEHLSSKSYPGFLFSPADRDRYVTTISERFSANVEETLRRADNICHRRFQFLGSSFEFGDDVNWHLDPDSGRSWPKVYFEKIGDWIWSEKRIGDFKFPWELNRHQYFFTLGKAYWLTGDERYADECASQISSWIHDNPPGMGINWYSSLEIGVRLISWGWAFHFFRSSSQFIAQAGNLFLKSLYQQAVFLRDNLTLNEEVRNNHIIGEAAGLIFVGSLFPEFIEAGEWLSTGLHVIEKELTLQTFAEGANKEQAISYHRFVLDFLLLVIVLGRRGAIHPSPQLEILLEKMLDYVMFTTTPNGGTPMIGDADEGRGYIFCESANFWDFRGSLAAGAVLYKRPDFKFIARDFGEEAFWLLGPEGLRAFEQLQCVIPDETSISFPEAGHYVIRDSWKENSDFAFLKCGPFGWGGDGFCSHSHCDLLSFVLYVNGKPIIVDSGTFTYHGSWRDQFRSTRAHNTLMVDDCEQASPLPYFGWRDTPQAKCQVWDGRRVVGVMQAVPGVKHQREINHPEAGVWEVTDTLLGERVHNVSWFFHFAPDLSLRLSDDFKPLIIGEKGKKLIIASPPPDVCIQTGSSWYSKNYGVKVENPLLKAFWEGEIPSSGKSFCWIFESIESTSEGMK